MTANHKILDKRKRRRAYIKANKLKKRKEFIARKEIKEAI